MHSPTHEGLALLGISDGVTAEAAMAIDDPGPAIVADVAGPLAPPRDPIPWLDCLALVPIASRQR